jgi:hypothetical protein
MKALERPAYIEYARLKASQVGEEGRVKKQIKSNPKLAKFWNLGHSAVVPKSFPSRECEIAFLLGQRNAQASDMDE